MKKEKFKTLLLAFLVLTTIFLSKNLRDVTLHNITNEYDEEKVEDEDSYKLSDVIIPKKATVSFGEREKTVLYSNTKYDLWKTANTTLKDIFKTKNMERNIVSQDIYNQFALERSVTFQFAENLYINMLGKILEVDIPKELYKNMETVENIKLSIGENSFLVFSNAEDNLILKIDQDKVSKLDELMTQIQKSDYTKFYKMEDVTEVKSNIFIPVKSNNKIATVYISTKYNIAKDVNLEDTLAELFFYKKIEYIKKIEENTGASIYIDDENILKIYEDGRLEYSGIIEENNDSDLYSSLKVAVEFVSKHRGWPENVFLSNIEPLWINDDIKGFKFIFRYKINGFTVLSNKDNIQDKIEVEVLNGSVTSYKSRIWNFLGMVTRESDIATLSAFEIYDDNFVTLKNAYMSKKQEEIVGLESEKVDEKVKRSIDDIYLAYYGYLNGKQEILNPVWVIEMMDEKYIFDAYSGKLKD